MLEPLTPKGETASAAILDAAERLFLQQGYSATSMRDIAEAAGYKSVAGIYNHFKVKEAIFQALLQVRSPYAEIFATVNQVEGESIEEVLPHLFQIMTVLVNKHINFVRLVLIDFLEFNATHINEILQQMSESFYGIMLKLQGLEGTNSAIPPIVLMRVLGMQVFGYVMTRSILPQEFLQLFSDEEWNQRVAQIILHGIREEKRNE